MAMFCKKPVVVEAKQVTLDNLLEIAEWATGNSDAASGDGEGVFISTLEGVMLASIGDWVIKGVKGEFYPCKPDIFEATYGEVQTIEQDGFIHKLETGEPDKQPTADEDLVAYLGMSAEVLNAVYNHSNNIRIKVACERALNMATRLGEEHRSMYIPYAEMVKSLFKEMETPAATLIHAGVGCAGEAGELLDALKKHWVYGKELDVLNVLEELGDMTFYMQHLLNTFGWTWADIRMANRMKLAKRYPDGVYSDALAQARLDKEGE